MSSASEQKSPSIIVFNIPAWIMDWFLSFISFIHSFTPFSSFIPIFLFLTISSILFSFLLSRFLLSNGMNWLPDNDLQYLCDDSTYMNCCPHLTKHKPAKRKAWGFSKNTTATQMNGTESCFRLHLLTHNRFRFQAAWLVLLYTKIKWKQKSAVYSF